MPLYDYKCYECDLVVEDVYFPLSSKEGLICLKCGKEMNKLFPVNVAAKVFNPQFVDDGVFVRNSSELKDHINRYNDSHQAQKTGKVAVYEKLSKREF